MTKTAKIRVEKKQTITPGEMTILLRVNEYDCLTTEQVQDIFGWSYRYAADRMQVLSMLGLFERKKLPHEDLGGATWLHRISEQGGKKIHEHDPFIKIPRFTMGSDKLVVSTQWWHTVYATNFLIQAHRWQETTTDVEIIRMETERALQRRSAEFPKALYTKSTTERVIPDGFTEIQFIDQNWKYRFCLELETGSHEMADVKDKVRNLVIFWETTYEQVFNADSVVFLFIAMGIKKKSIPAEKHRKMILVAIAETLREMGRLDYAELFAVTSVSTREKALFTEPVWYTPVVTNESYDPHGLFD
jgi:hypothetical protein